MRPKLKLQPRAKPEEKTENKENSQPQAMSSIFGSAKPVDTSAREKEVMQPRVKVVEEKKEKNSQPSASPFGSAKPVDTSAREKEIEEKLNTMPVRPRREDAGDAAPVSRQNSSASHHSDEGSMEALRSPTVKTSPDAPKLVVAPAPKENPWGKKPVSTEADSTNNATTTAPAPGPTSPPTQAPVTKAPEARQPRDIPAPTPKTNAWGKGPNAAARSDKPREPAHGKGRQEEPPKPRKEKHIPTHYDEMPKYEENKNINIADGNKFAFLEAEDNDEEEQES